MALVGLPGIDDHAYEVVLSFEEEDTHERPDSQSEGHEARSCQSSDELDHGCT